MAQMVWCKSCNKVVWAYDHYTTGGLSETCNLFQLACPKCGSRGNYDGWGFESLSEEVKAYLEKTAPVYDYWSAMRAYAQLKQLEWDPSPDNVWR